MDLLRRSRPITAWFAALAVLLGALAPAAGPAVAAVRGGGDWVQLCSTSGMAWVRVDANGDITAQDLPEHPGDASRHCAWCQLGDGTYLLLQVLHLQVVPIGSLPVAMAGDDPLASPQWPSAMSRAPPRT